jgi:hypothetical protein
VGVEYFSRRRPIHTGGPESSGAERGGEQTQGLHLLPVSELEDHAGRGTTVIELPSAKTLAIQDRHVEVGRLEPIENPFGPKVLPMSPE